MYHLFAVSPPGLEPYTARELTQLGIPPGDGQSSAQPFEHGGIEFSGDLDALYRANLYTRTASRILLRFGQFHAASFSELDKGIKKLPWARYLSPGTACAIRVTCHKSRLYHSSAVAREIATSISAYLRHPIQQTRFDENASNVLPQLIVVRLNNDQCTISIDTSGAHLHRRGYRLATAKAPLRENLAAGLLMASGWDMDSPLLDPFCGSGTIPIEAALMALHIPPGAVRRFAFMDWPGYQAERWEAILTESKRQITNHTTLIQASDRDAGAITLARANAERAGVATSIEFSHRAISAIEPSAHGYLVTNPPYGLRVSKNKDLRNLYAQLGKVLRKRCPGWTVAILCNDFSLLRQLGIPLNTELSLVNGGVSVLVGRAIVPQDQP